MANLSNEEKFKAYYRAQIHVTDQKVAIPNPNINYAPMNLFTYSQDSVMVERVISIKMTESDYKNFMDGFGKYVELIHGVEDPIIANMFHEVLMMIKLKQ